MGGRVLRTLPPNLTINLRIKNRRDTDANWKSRNQVLLDGELSIVASGDGNLNASTAYNYVLNVSIKRLLKTYKHIMYDKYSYREVTVKYIFDKVNEKYYNIIRIL